jgi:putative transposase
MLSRKKRFGKNWYKQAGRLAKLHHKIANVRKDFLHKESTKIAKANHYVILEDLNVAGMSRSNLAKNILDAGWATFRQMLAYKTTVIPVSPKFTSQICSSCGHKDKESRISQSRFVCTDCGYEQNADHNAAKNILDRGTVVISQRRAIAQAYDKKLNLQHSSIN